VEEMESWLASIKKDFKGWLKEEDDEQNKKNSTKIKDIYVQDPTFYVKNNQPFS
jgi:hypothetical protein